MDYELFNMEEFFKKAKKNKNKGGNKNGKKRKRSIRRN